MIKTLRNLLKQDKERFVVPRGVQDVIPIKAIYDDGIFQVGRDKFSKTYKFSDINYAVASREDKEAMFLEYSELLNSLDSGATTKILIAVLVAVLGTSTYFIIDHYKESNKQARTRMDGVREKPDSERYRLSLLLTQLCTTGLQRLGKPFP